MVWGLVPHWSNDGRNDGLLINARQEGIASKPSFRIPFRQRRCLVPADSFYEWRNEGGQKIPYRIQRKDGRLLLFAGIWDLWDGAAGPLHTFSIITTEANAEMSGLHNRMPVILSNESDQLHWLRSDKLDDLLLLVRFREDDILDMYRVSVSVNSPVHNYPGLHDPVPEPPRLF
jgi:putative SOS response-associated peptidase YedK